MNEGVQWVRVVEAGEMRVREGWRGCEGWESVREGERGCRRVGEAKERRRSNNG